MQILRKLFVPAFIIISFASCIVYSDRPHRWHHHYHHAHGERYIGPRR